MRRREGREVDEVALVIGPAVKAVPDAIEILGGPSVSEPSATTGCAVKATRTKVANRNLANINRFIPILLLGYDSDAVGVRFAFVEFKPPF